MWDMYGKVNVYITLQGIEALETWVDPNSQSPETAEGENKDVPGTNGVSADLPTANQNAPPKIVEAPPKPVICKKGKCQPYDPTKDRVSRIFKSLHCTVFLLCFHFVSETPKITNLF